MEGIVIGFMMAAPVGPVGVLCMRRTLDKGRRSGIISGLGAATADTMYGAVAAYGLTFISRVLINLQPVLRLVGGIFLIYLGCKYLLARNLPQEINLNNRNKPLGDYSSTFFLTITNPLTIIFFTVIFSAMGLGKSSENHITATVLLFGVFFGSVTWWVILSLIAGLIRKRFNPDMLRKINRAIGIVMIIFGLAVIFVFTKMINYGEDHFLRSDTELTKKTVPNK